MASAGAGCQIHVFSSGTPMTVGWRMLSGNNRELGRTAHHYATEDACRRALAEIRAVAAELRPHVRRVKPNHWTWELCLVEEAVAVAGHPFDRLIRCESALAAFRAHFALAPIAATVVNSGSRRWRATPVAPGAALRVSARPEAPVVAESGGVA